MYCLYLGIAVILEISVAISAGGERLHRLLLDGDHPDQRRNRHFLPQPHASDLRRRRRLCDLDLGSGVGIVVLGTVFFGQQLNVAKIAGIVVVIGGVVGLRLSGAA